VTAGKLRAIGCHRLVDVRTVSDEVLGSAVGSYAGAIRRFSLGEDERPVVPDRKAKSCGCEDTYAQDMLEMETIVAEVTRMAGKCTAWLERKGLLARTITVKVRYSNFETVTRSASKREGTRDLAEVAARAVMLVGRTEAGRRPVRLLGVSVHGLLPAEAPTEGAREGEGLLVT
jgi:DNA polymerase-4